MPDNMVIQTIMDQLGELRKDSKEQNSRLVEIGSGLNALRETLKQSDHEARIAALEEKISNLLGWLRVFGLILGVVWPILYPLINEFIRSQFK